jgi:hypothetical protein
MARRRWARRPSKVSKVAHIPGVDARALEVHVALGVDIWVPSADDQ